MANFWLVCREPLYLGITACYNLIAYLWAVYVTINIPRAGQYGVYNAECSNRIQQEGFGLYVVTHEYITCILQTTLL